MNFALGTALERGIIAVIVAVVVLAYSVVNGAPLVPQNVAGAAFASAVAVTIATMLEYAGGGTA